MGNITAPRVRTTGHAYSLWIWGDQPVAYCTNVVHTSPAPKAEAADVQPLNYVRPAEIAVGRAIGSGKIDMTVVELYGHKAWEHLGGSFGTEIKDLADVFHKFQQVYTEHTPDTMIRFVRVIRPPGANIQVEQYHNIRILNITENENVLVESVTNQLQISIGYTHKSSSSVADVGGNFTDPGRDPQFLPNPRVY